jgi:hypothetical protein
MVNDRDGEWSYERQAFLPVRLLYLDRQVPASSGATAYDCHLHVRAPPGEQIERATHYEVALGVTTIGKEDWNS